MAFVTPDIGKVTRRLVLAPDAVTVDNSEGVDFMCYLAPEREQVGVADEASPRDLPSKWLRWAAGILGPQDNAPRRSGDRVMVNDVTYELLGNPSQLRTGRRVVGIEVAVNSVDVLYPYAAALELNDGTVVEPNLPIAMWAPSETVTDRSGYTDFSAEAPVEFYTSIKPNSVVAMNGNKYHITRSYVSPSGPRVSMTLRRKSKNG